jgi:hypothetical protein
VVVAVEKDSAMAPKKVDYAVLPSSVRELRDSIEGFPSMGVAL